MKTWSAVLAALALFGAVYAEETTAEGKDARCGATPTKASGSHAPSHFCSGDLIFSDDFDEFDLEKWQHENTLGGGGNWEFQWYANNRSNSFTRNGHLYIRPSLMSEQFGLPFLTNGHLNVEGGAPADRCTNPQWWGCERTGSPNNMLNPIRSARIRTVETFRFAYGRVEVRAKMPAGDWLWPAIWLMPSHNVYGTWPASGEIDLVESRGNRHLTVNGVNIGVEQVGSTLHYGPHPGLNAWDTTHFTRNWGPGFHNDFHRYELVWTPDYMEFIIDGYPLGRVNPGNSFWNHGNFAANAPNTHNPWQHGSKMAPFDEKFYLILNVAVGGTVFFPDNAHNPHPKPWNNNAQNAPGDFWNGQGAWLPTWNMDTDDSSMQVDYVRVWAL